MSPVLVERSINASFFPISARLRLSAAKALLCFSIPNVGNLLTLPPPLDSLSYISLPNLTPNVVLELHQSFFPSAVKPFIHKSNSQCELLIWPALLLPRQRRSRSYATIPTHPKLAERSATA